MELIIKPTELCNFKCTFCSSTNIADNKKSVLSHEKIFQFLERFPETSTIIVNGGDPLMMPPEYYFKILKYIEENGLNTSLSFTSNLWAFYKNPKKWAPLFRHPAVGVTTSFHYGKTRKITKERIFEEKDFLEISQVFLDEVGYRPDFISVITSENFDTALDNVYLAQRLDVECKLNYALMSGDQKQPFPKGKIYSVYLDIIDKGLHPWEYNAKQLLNMRNSLSTTCPLNRSCDSSIRALQPEGDYYSCGAFGDDRLFQISFDKEVLEFAPKATPLADAQEIHFLKEECLSCPLFNICNGCKKTIHDIKSLGWVEFHCSEMMKNKDKLSALIHNEAEHHAIY